SGSTELGWARHLVADSLRTDKPAARFGATGARCGFRATFHRARCCRDDQVGATSSLATSGACASPLRGCERKSNRLAPPFQALESKFVEAHVDAAATEGDALAFEPEALLHAGMAA